VFRERTTRINTLVPAARLREISKFVQRVAWTESKPVFTKIRVDGIGFDSNEVTQDPSVGNEVFPVRTPRNPGARDIVRIGGCMLKSSKDPDGKLHSGLAGCNWVLFGWSIVDEVKHLAQDKSPPLATLPRGSGLRLADDRLTVAPPFLGEVPSSMRDQKLSSIDQNNHGRYKFVADL
jgi:hypothetical protein